MSIQRFLQNPDNYVTREKIFLDKIKFDLKLAAAHAQVPLQIFTPDVDRDGYDIIVNDADCERRFQLKSFLTSSTTGSWDIYKRLLRPSINNASALSFEFSPEGIGLEGGVILIEINEVDDACPVTYYYTDIFVLTALGGRMICTSSNKRELQALDVLTALHRGIGRERVGLSRGVFLKVRSAPCLLAIAGFHSREHAYTWWGNLIIGLRGNFRVDKTPLSQAATDRGLTAQVRHGIEGLASMIDEPDLQIFPWKG